MKQLKAEGVLRPRCRQRQYEFLNNMVEQDVRVLKRQGRPPEGHRSFKGAWRTPQDIHSVSMVRQDWAREAAKTDVTSQSCFIGKLFGLASRSSWEQIRRSF